MSIWETNGGIYLGHRAEALQGPWNGDRYQHRYDGDRSLILFGPSGSGKTRRLLYPNLLGLQDWSILVVDPKGLLATLCHDKRQGQQIVIDPYHVTNLPSVGINPLSPLDPEDEDFADDCLALARAIIEIRGDEPDPHWPESAQDLVCSLIAYVILKPLAPSYLLIRDDQQEDDLLEPLPKVTPDLACVRRLLGLREGKLKRLIHDMISLGEVMGHEELSIKAGRFASINPANEELNSIVSNALTQTRWLDSRPIKRSLTGGSFDFAEMKDRVITVFLVLPPKRLITHAAYTRLIITSVMQPLLSEIAPANVPVLAMIDEFTQLGRISIIEENQALIREYGLKLWLVAQDKSKGEATYGKHFGSLMSNSGIIQSFGVMDVETAEWLSKRSGQTTEWIDVPSESRTLTPEPSRSFTSGSQVIQRPVLWPHDFFDMDEGYTALYSHRAKGPTFSFAPWPRTL
jgi:type IV secretion system protein VirD4